MHELTIDELRSRQLDILLAFDRICRENDLRYELAFGTLIGAVRHHGYIPWDDDIDVMMPQADYVKLINIINDLHTGGVVDGRFRFAEFRIESPIPYHQTFMKVYDTETRASVSTLKPEMGFEEGVFIDVFFVSGIPEDGLDEKLARLQEASDMVYYCTGVPQAEEMSWSHPRWALKSRRGYRRAAQQPLSHWQNEWLDALSAFPDSDGAKRAWCLPDLTAGFAKEAIDDNPWFPTTTLTFEGHELPVPAQYDHVLTQFYGDYMKLPPEDQQVRSHDQKFFLKE